MFTSNVVASWLSPFLRRMLISLLWSLDSMSLCVCVCLFACGLDNCLSIISWRFNGTNRMAMRTQYVSRTKLNQHDTIPFYESATLNRRGGVSSNGPYQCMHMRSHSVDALVCLEFPHQMCICCAWFRKCKPMHVLMLFAVFLFFVTNSLIWIQIVFNALWRLSISVVFFFLHSRLSPHLTLRITLSAFWWSTSDSKQGIRYSLR